MKNQFGGAIYALRKSKGLTQAQLGEKINISETAVSKWERGVTLPDIETLCKVADYFEISLEEVLGRDKSQLRTSSKYTQEQVQSYETGLQLMKCCEAARNYGLLAMEEYVLKAWGNAFLVFCIQFVLSGMRKGLSVEQIFLLLQNYALAEPMKSNAAMIVKVLECIVSGESEEMIKETIASCLGRGLYEKWMNETLCDVICREQILEKYSNRQARFLLLEELRSCTDIQIRILLKEVDYELLVNALAGASGELCIQFLSNLSDRIMSFMDEDICSCSISPEQMLQAQRNVLEKAVEWKIIVPERGR